MPPFRFVEGESDVAHHVVQQATVLADGFIHARLFKGVGIGNRRKFVKRRAHVQRRSVPAQRQIHCPARLMGRRAQLIFAGFRYKFVADLLQFLSVRLRMFLFQYLDVFLEQRFLHAQRAKRIVNQKGIFLRQQIQRRFQPLVNARAHIAVREPSLHTARRIAGSVGNARVRIRDVHNCFAAFCRIGNRISQSPIVRTGNRAVQIGLNIHTQSLQHLVTTLSISATR